MKRAVGVGDVRVRFAIMAFTKRSNCWPIGLPPVTAVICREVERDGKIEIEAVEPVDVSYSGVRASRILPCAWRYTTTDVTLLASQWRWQSYQQRGRQFRHRELDYGVVPRVFESSLSKGSGCKLPGS